MEIKDLEVKLGGIATQIEAFIKKHDEEVKTNGTASSETKATLEKLGNDWNEMKNRMLAVEQKMTADNPGAGGTAKKSAGAIFAESATYQSAVKNQWRHSDKVEVGSLFGTKTNVVNASGQNQPLVPDYRVPGILAPGIQRLTIRDLIPSLQTSSNLVQYTKETGFTNNAAMQASEGAVKAESAMTFALANAPVQTLAHFIPVSRQILEDAPAIQGYIDTRLMYGLKLIEEGQLLNGSGSGVNLSGLITNATAMSTANAVTATDTYIDTLFRGKVQVETSFFTPTAFVLNPQDWASVQLTKTTGTASSGQYIFADPHSVQTPSIWGLPVVSTPSMAQGQFLVGAFDIGATIWDRASATVEISREHSDFFTRNLVAILVEERLALTVYNALAFVYGGFPFGS